MEDMGDLSVMRLGAISKHCKLAGEDYFPLSNAIL